MELALDLVYVALLAIGGFFLFTATLGLFRMPDVITRMHATTKCDTVAAGCILAAVALRAGDWIIVGKLFLAFLFILMINPCVAHIIGWAAYSEEKKESAKGEAV
jgi:multicomponent Na+:H+ antiporter subunit G